MLCACIWTRFVYLHIVLCCVCRCVSLDQRSWQETAPVPQILRDIVCVSIILWELDLLWKCSVVHLHHDNTITLNILWWLSHQQSILRGVSKCFICQITFCWLAVRVSEAAVVQLRKYESSQVWINLGNFTLFEFRSWPRVDTGVCFCVCVCVHAIYVKV